MGDPLLSIDGLSTVFDSEDGPIVAVDGLSLAVAPGEIAGLVGESGCGKSLTALSVMGLLPPHGRVAAGRILFEGTDLLTLSSKRMRALRGEDISMIFQEPMTSLNPVFTVGRQIAEEIVTYREGSRAEAWQRAIAMLDKVGIPEPKARAKAYPHQLSGGMRQRVMIAMALALDPKLLIADEPTTALDVTIQAQILELMRHLQSETGAAVLLITHNLAVVAQTCSRVMVMYTGRLVEDAAVDELFDHPLHPYTQGLLACLPARAPRPGQKLPTIGGIVPALGHLPRGCAFSDRCPQAFEPCRQAEPALVEVEPGHSVRCYLHHDQARPERRIAA
ncbi:MAG: ABC transporter ATP-binding protein [Desulfarculaceae bacterium]|nr:ABC transporter ATP-binding protein [Desulfarculaceae bacterium]MCF8073988.1 ABC transporter ATP-binding protein [Desulfarculaceae bacterium]MCF8102674.1 ABC transporter ATP-binding protein [Desulfarculaceae bacterium]MCF8116085.1 ABC transporter ATP-binding protein [Desulfarculaceae bacterium]